MQHSQRTTTTTQQQHVHYAHALTARASMKLPLPTSHRLAFYRSIQQEEYSGILTACTPLFALFSSVLYSVWTNKTFRDPMICSALLLAGGNLLYAASYDSSSVGKLQRGLLTRHPCRNHFSHQNKKKTSHATSLHFTSLTSPRFASFPRPSQPWPS